MPMLAKSVMVYFLAVVRYENCVKLPDHVQLKRGKLHAGKRLPCHDFMRQVANTHAVAGPHTAHFAEVVPQVSDLDRAWQWDQVFRRNPASALDDFKVLAQCATITLKLAEA
jgi:hypothetical protein